MSVSAFCWESVLSLEVQPSRRLLRVVAGNLGARPAAESTARSTSRICGVHGIRGKATAGCRVRMSVTESTLRSVDRERADGRT